VTLTARAGGVQDEAKFRLTLTPAPATLTHVLDGARFFSPKAVAEAERVIDGMSRTYGKQLRIETVPEAPADLKGQMAGDRATRTRLFDGWARQRARDLRVNGIFVLVCKDPAHLQVVVGDDTTRRAFTVANRDKLAQMLLTAFRAKEYDRGLSEAVEFVRGSMERNLSNPGKEPRNDPDPSRAQVR
jgi:uncharacterized membrane protein YgcG